MYVPAVGYRLTESVEVWVKSIGLKAVVARGEVLTVRELATFYGALEVVVDIPMIRARSIRL